MMETYCVCYGGPKVTSKYSFPFIFLKMFFFNKELSRTVITIANCFWTVITAANRFPTVITVANCFQTVTTIENCFESYFL